LGQKMALAENLHPLFCLLDQHRQELPLILKEVFHSVFKLDDENRQAFRLHGGYHV
jgi:hypothetical protein